VSRLSHTCLSRRLTEVDVASAPGHLVGSRLQSLVLIRITRMDLFRSLPALSSRWHTCEYTSIWALFGGSRRATLRSLHEQSVFRQTSSGATAARWCACGAGWRRHRTGREPAQAAERADLEAARDAKYAEIRDAEMDFRTGKLSEPDWRALDRQLRREAVELLHRLDEVT